jgi:hypothetical protein
MGLGRRRRHARRHAEGGSTGRAQPCNQHSADRSCSHHVHLRSSAASSSDVTNTRGPAGVGGFNLVDGRARQCRGTGRRGPRSGRGRPKARRPSSLVGSDYGGLTDLVAQIRAALGVVSPRGATRRVRRPCRSKASGWSRRRGVETCPGRAPTLRGESAERASDDIDVLGPRLVHVDSRPLREVREAHEQGAAGGRLRSRAVEAVPPRSRCRPRWSRRC